MILYYALTKYHILSVLLHKEKYSKSEGATLILSEKTEDVDELTNRIKELKIFSEVLIMNDRIMDQNNSRYVLLDKDTRINEIIQDIKKIIPVRLSKFEKIIIAADHFPLGMYLSANKIHYSLFEDGCGQASRSDEVIENVIKKVNIVQYETIKELNLFGKNEYVDIIYANCNAQIEGWTNNKAREFSVAELLKQMSDEYISKIKHVFNITDQAIDAEGRIFFLPQHNVNMGIFTNEQQKNLSSLLIDYFSENEGVCIKPHPNDIQTDYSKVFNDSTILSRKFPSELLPLIIKNKFKLGITAWSTSIKQMNEILEDSICFTSQIDYTYEQMHRYYAITLLLNCISSNNYTIYGFGINKFQLENLNNRAFAFKNSPICIKEITHIQDYNYDKNKKILIFNDIDLVEGLEIEGVNNILENIGDADLAVFINWKQDFIFYNGRNKKVFNNMSFISIAKEKIDNKDITVSLEEEGIWMYSLSKQIKEEIIDLNCKKSLNNTGINIYVYNKDVDKSIQNGILKATERRLAEEIENVRRLEMENEELRNKIEELIGIV